MFVEQRDRPLHQHGHLFLRDGGGRRQFGITKLSDPVMLRLFWIETSREHLFAVDASFG